MSAEGTRGDDGVRRWRVRLPEGGRRVACGPMELFAEAAAEEVVICASCERCGKVRTTRLMAMEVMLGAQRCPAPTRLLPRSERDETGRHPPCSPDPGWQGRIERLWAACVQSARPERWSGSVRVAPELRQRVLRTIVEDPTGEVRELVKREPLVVAILAAMDEAQRVRPSAKRAEAWRERLKGRPPEEVLVWVARQHGVTDPRAWARLHRLVRRVVSHAPPGQVVAASRLPFPEQDVPAEPRACLQWLEAMATLAGHMKTGARPGPGYALASRYLSRHYRALASAVASDRWVKQWLSWMLLSGHRPGRHMPPEDMLAEMDEFRSWLQGG